MPFIRFDTRTAVAWLTAVLLLAAAPLADLEITGTILYGYADGAKTGADCDHEAAFARAPAEIHRRALGLSTSSDEGQQLFARAQSGWRKALARVAADEGVDVITVKGGVSGGDAPIVDVTDAVVERLPKYYVHGEVLHGRAKGAESIAEVDSQALLDAIPEYREFQALEPTDARYHLLRRAYMEAYASALRVAAGDAGHDCLVEVGGVTTRLDVLDDLTQAAIDAIDS